MRRTGMRWAAATRPHFSPLGTWERQVAGVLSAAKYLVNRMGGFSRSLRRKAPRFFDAPARTGPERLRVLAAILAHPIEESPPERLTPRVKAGRAPSGTSGFCLY